MGRERRASPRFPMDGVLRVEKHERDYPVRVLDISDTGVRFEASQAFEAETLVRVILDHYPIDVPLRALVAWSRESSEGRVEHGGEFVNLPRAEHILVHQFIEELQHPRKEDAEPDEEPS